MLDSVLNMPEYGFNFNFEYILDSEHSRDLDMKELHRVFNMQQCGYKCLDRT